MYLSEDQLGWIMGCLFLIGIVLAYPARMTAIALIRDQRLAGKLYWHLRAALDRKERGK